jgi:hypothetical protein
MADIPPRGGQRFAAITYALLGKWAGLKASSVRKYANRGEFEPDDMDSALQWVNTRRQAKHLPLIGIPAGYSGVNKHTTPVRQVPANVEEEAGCIVQTSVLPENVRGNSGYNPDTGEYQ